MFRECVSVKTLFVKLGGLGRSVLLQSDICSLVSLGSFAVLLSDVLGSLQWNKFGVDVKLDCNGLSVLCDKGDLSCSVSIGAYL